VRLMSCKRQQDEVSIQPIHAVPCVWGRLWHTHLLQQYTPLLNQVTATQHATPTALPIATVMHTPSETIHHNHAEGSTPKIYSGIHVCVDNGAIGAAGEAKNTS
jgi:hypothetical protein